LREFAVKRGESVVKIELGLFLARLTSLKLGATESNNVEQTRNSVNYDVVYNNYINFIYTC
jgi:hypothetical protein